MWDLTEEELINHNEFVRRLARQVVGADEAEDLAQEVMLRALSSPPRVKTGAAVRA